MWSSTAMGGDITEKSALSNVKRILGYNYFLLFYCSSDHYGNEKVGEIHLIYQNLTKNKKSKLENTTQFLKTKNPQPILTVFH